LHYKHLAASHADLFLACLPLLYFFLQAVQIVALQSVHHEQRSTDVPQEEHHAVSEVLESDVTWLHFYLFVHLALKVGCFRICYRSSLTNLPFVNTLSLEVLLVEAFFGWVEQRVVKVLEVLLDEPDDAHMYYKVLARKRGQGCCLTLGLRPMYLNDGFLGICR
jgi:hypothetical protein